MSDYAPFISLLTGTRNRAALVRAAIESARAQQGASYEHIVVDAMSTDETPAVLAKYPELRVIREPDRGFFDGLNKALRVARGEVVGLLNSDDLLPAGALAAVTEAFRDPQVELVTGGCDFFVDGHDGMTSVAKRMSAADELKLSLGNMLRGNPVINARFFRRSFMERVGEFNQGFPIAGDREWLIRAALARPRQTVIAALVYRYRQHEGSLTVHETDRNVARYRAEHVAIAEKQLCRGDVVRADRRELRTFHARESAALATLQLTSGQLRGAWEWARRGWRVSSCWPLALAQRLAGHALGF